MLFLVIHVVVYAVVGVAIVVSWLMAGGSADALSAPLQAARDEGFWPLWIIVGWGTVVALHATIAVPVSWSLRRRRARRRDEPESGRRWIAVMFTDLAGSTALAEQLGDEAWAELIGGYRETARDAAGTHDGREVGTQGDGVLFRFDSPRDAVACASDLRVRFAEERSRGSSLPPVRIGIHAGEAIARDGDLLGQMVNLASRVADVAGPDEILVTEPVADHCDPGTAFEDRGLQQLAGIRSPRHLLALRDGEG